MQTAYDVIVYGTVALDAIWRVEELSPPGGYASILEERKMIGGEASNTALALHKWGLRVALVGNALGDDTDGRLLRELFARDAPGLDTRFLQTLPDARTPYCVCIATPDGERTMYGSGFDDWQCTPLDPALARRARWFTMDPNAWEPSRQAALIAAGAGLNVLAMDYTRDPLLCEKAALSVTSREHLRHLSTLDDLARHAARLRDTHGPTVILTCGADGCFVAAREQTGPAIHIPAYPAPHDGGRDRMRRHLPGWPAVRPPKRMGTARLSTLRVRRRRPELRRDGRLGRRPVRGGNHGFSGDPPRNTRNKRKVKTKNTKAKGRELDRYCARGSCLLVLSFFILLICFFRLFRVFRG